MNVLGIHATMAAGGVSDRPRVDKKKKKGGEGADKGYQQRRRTQRREGGVAC